MIWLILWAVCSAITFVRCVQFWESDQPTGAEIFSTFVMTVFAPVLLMLQAFELLCRAAGWVKRRVSR